MEFTWGKKYANFLTMSLAIQNGKALKYSYRASQSNRDFLFLYSILSSVRKRHLAFLVQILYGKIKKSKPYMNILMPYHFGKLITCTKSWHIFFPAHIPLKPIFRSPEPCKVKPDLYRQFEQVCVFSTSTVVYQ